MDGQGWETHLAKIGKGKYFIDTIGKYLASVQRIETEVSDHEKLLGRELMSWDTWAEDHVHLFT